MQRSDDSGKSPGVKEPSDERQGASQETGDILMRVMDLPDWPPKPAKSYEGGSVLFDDAQMERVIGDVEGRVSFVCKRYGESIPFEFFIWDKKNSKMFQKILDEHAGMTLFDLGFVALPLD
jgi:hypothetical protein